MKKEIFLALLLASCTTSHQELHESLDETLKIIDEQYPGEVSQEKLRQGMLQGLIKAVDKNAAYLSETDLKIILNNVEGGTLKLGLAVEKMSQGFFVKKAYKGAPADKAGIHDGDILISFENAPLKDLSILAFMNLVNEKKPYKVALLRGHKEIEVEITPDFFIPPSTELKWHGNVAHIKFNIISKNAGNEIRQHLDAIQNHTHAKALILDLRDCLGGSFQGAVNVAGYFVNGQVVVEKQDRKDILKISSQSFDVSKVFPIIILQNKRTYAGGEIIVAALKAHKKATLIGENTGGSAILESVMQFNQRKDGLILPVAFLNSPNGKRIDNNGLEPDIRVHENEKPKKGTSDLYVAEAMKYLSHKK